MSEQTFDIKNSAGEVVARHLRFGDGSRKRLEWQRPDGSSGLGGLPVQALPLYGIHLVGRPHLIVVTEGEKAAQALLARRIPSVGTVTGASTIPCDNSLADLAGKVVVLWPDNDAVGRKHMRAIAERLDGVASAVKWVVWSDAPDHGDAADHPGPAEAIEGLIDAAGDVPPAFEFSKTGTQYRFRIPDQAIEVRAEQLRLVRGDPYARISVMHGSRRIVSTSLFVNSANDRKRVADYLRSRDFGPDWVGILEDASFAISEAESAGEPIVRLATVPTRRGGPDMLLSPLLERGQATNLYGTGKVGKSYLAAACAVSVASGECVIDGWNPQGHGPVLVLDWEADAETWATRIREIASGVRLDPDHLEVQYRYQQQSFMEQADTLAAVVAEQGIALVIIDSVMAASSAGDGDPNDAAQRFMNAVRSLRCTTLLVDHVTGAHVDSADEAQRPFGAVSKVNRVRALWELRRKGQESYSPTRQLILRNVSRNNGPVHAAIELEVSHVGGAVSYRVLGQSLYEQVAEAVQLED